MGVGALDRLLSWIAATAAFFLGGLLVLVPAAFLTAGVRWLSWRIHPGWGFSLPAPLLATVTLALTGGVLCAASRRSAYGGLRFGRRGILPLVFGAALGLGGWFAAFMVDFGVGPWAVSELQLLDTVEMPSGFVEYDSGFQGHEAGANAKYAGPSDALSPHAVRVPGLRPVPYTTSVQIYPEGWRPLARWAGADPFGAGYCEVSMDVARKDVGAYELDGLSEADVAAVRAGSKRVVYLVAYC